ncbi:protein SMAX1-LIKE 6-like [Quillaja saponaria]|uniref:Protein SMAX1-LIKE 6-like n=1 Tax=Quillaja saponaria TaxID=32244 RepID=A0AAD7PQ82_QUISA|nr:protein SMAX1-LIKE 6-like [Quillaja saponaria]
MPTAVSAARQCLTEEASCAIDDAVAVARRRSHAQTSSLHAVSALLAFPSSTLRDACTRARSCSYSPRRQFRALELSVGFSLDRIPTSKTVEDEPPISNSLMAAIKRSQANQRRHPDSFYLLQIHSQQQQAASFLKVELKHLILSILDDPIVSRVFGEVGFRSCDIKLAILQPPVAQSSRFPQTRSPPIFLCNLTGSEAGRPGFNFPFMGSSGSEDGDENCRRIGEVLVRKTGKNPLLLGVCAGDALRSFRESVQRGRVSFLPAEIAGLNVICIEKEISEFVAEGGSKEKIGLKFKELSLVAEQCSGPGVAVSFGELEAFVGDGVCNAAVSFVVSRLTSLLEIGGGKLWLVGASGTCDIYSKFIALFPTVDKDWDLHLLPITSASPSMEGLNSNSSLMRSFIPFGGFFSTQSEFRNPLSSTNQSFSRCHLCTEKYEHEVSDILKVDLNTLVSDSSASLPLLQRADFDTSKAVDAAKTEDGQASSNAKIVELQSKWNDICQHLHHTRPLPKFDVSQTRYLAPSAEDFRFTEWSGSRSKDLSLNESQYASSSPYIPREAQKIFPPKQFLQLPVVSDVVNINSGIEHVAEVSKNQQIDLESPWCAPFPMANPSLHDSPSSFSLVSVTTDLGLGTLYTSSAQEPNTPKLRDHKKYIQHLSDSISAEFDSVNESNSCRIAGSSTCFSPNSGSKFDLGDFKSLNQIIAEKVGSQYEAICAISRSLSLHRSGIVKHCGSNFRRDIWFTFLGPDKVGKRKIASALGEIVFGNTESIISVDFNSHDRVSPLNSIFGSQEFYAYDVKLRGKTIVDYIAGELRKKPHSVVFLENVDKADVMAQSSLSKAIRTGKFPDSHGREISINNVIFVVTSTNIKGNSNFIMEKEPTTFSEERILEAKTCQMQILLGHVAEDAKRSSSMNVKVTSRKETKKPSSRDKRKLDECNDSNEHEAIPKIQKQDLKAPRSFLDLNLPLEDIEEDINYNDDYESESITENSEAWLDDFFDQVNEKVVFKHFNFDELAKKVLNSISLELQRTFGPETLLEIDNEVMVHILAAAWLSSDRKRAVEDWVDVVLGRSFYETLQKYNPAAQSVLKLVACEGLSQKEQAPGICLPAKINLN